MNKINTVHCDIVSAEAAIFNGEVKMVIAHGALGDLGIAPGHAPLLTSLKPGPVRLIKDDNVEEVFYISGGFLEVQSKLIKILADTIIRAADIDEAAAKRAVQEAEKKLNIKGSNFDYSAAASHLAEVSAQLRTVQQLHKKYS